MQLSACSAQAGGANAHSLRCWLGAPACIICLPPHARMRAGVGAHHAGLLAHGCVCVVAHP